MCLSSAYVHQTFGITTLAACFSAASLALSWFSASQRKSSSWIVTCRRLDTMGRRSGTPSGSTKAKTLDKSCAFRRSYGGFGRPLEPLDSDIRRLVELLRHVPVLHLTRETSELSLNIRGTFTTWAQVQNASGTRCHFLVRSSGWLPNRPVHLTKAIVDLQVYYIAIM